MAIEGKRGDTAAATRRSYFQSLATNFGMMAKKCCLLLGAVAVTPNLSKIYECCVFFSSMDSKSGTQHNKVSSIRTFTEISTHTYTFFLKKTSNSDCVANQNENLFSLIVEENRA